MKDPITLARRIFLVAGIYGLVATLPLYFSEHPQGIDYPPDITHPEWYYGFAGVVTAWAILFFVSFKGSDPLPSFDDSFHHRKILVSARSGGVVYAGPRSGFVSSAGSD
ncbi:MAG: hypothetical protein WEB37_03070 [Bacteroidota bacterium]